MVSYKKAQHCSFVYLGPPTELGKMSPTFHAVADICLDCPEKCWRTYWYWRGTARRNVLFKSSANNDKTTSCFLCFWLWSSVFFQSIGRSFRPCQACLLVCGPQPLIFCPFCNVRISLFFFKFSEMNFQIRKIKSTIESSDLVSFSSSPAYLLQEYLLSGKVEIHLIQQSLHCPFPLWRNRDQLWLFFCIESLSFLFFSDLANVGVLLIFFFFLDPPTLKVGPIDWPMSVRPFVRSFVRSLVHGRGFRTWAGNF